MRRKHRSILKFMLVVLIACISIISLSDVANAAAIQDLVFDNTSVKRSLLDEVDSVSDTGINRLRNAHLNYGSIKIAKVSPTRARITASTQAHHVCEEVYLDLYLDRYNDKTHTWDQIRDWSFTENDVQHVTRGIECIVLSGYYYSLRGVHVCKHGKVIETGLTQTEGLYIGLTDTP